MSYLNKFYEYLEQNREEVLEILDDLKESSHWKRLRQQLPKEFLDQLDTRIKTFINMNGLFNRVDFKKLTDEEKFLFNLFNITKQQTRNRYRQKILSYYFENLDLQMKKINMAKAMNSNYLYEYYQETPAALAGLEKIAVKFPDIKELNKIKIHGEEFGISELIRIGTQIQFNSPGFCKNQMLYLLFGVCIVDCLGTEHKNFYELINHLTSYAQLNLLNKVFNAVDCKEDGIFIGNEFSENDFNLQTYLKFNNGTYNFRYKIFEKYKENKTEDNGKTEIVEDDTGKYLLTKYTKEELLELWKEFEEDYQGNGINEKLIVKWFDSQCLTRSTCLIGVLLIILKEMRNGNFIRFNDEELPDLKAIISGTINDTYKADKMWRKFNFTGNDSPTLGEVLGIVKKYISTIINI